MLYYCHRASCGKKGVVSDSSARQGTIPKKFEAKKFTGSLIPLLDTAFDSHIRPYELTWADVAEQGIKFAEESQRIYFPILDYRGFQIGENLRSLHAYQKPKALIYPWTEAPLIHFPLCGERTKREIYSLCFSEDQISSIKVAKATDEESKVSSASLLGTSLTESGLKLLRDIGVKKIILMLDGDNAGRVASAKIANKARPFFEVSIAYLPEGKDPKHLKLQQLQEIISCLR